MCKPHSNDYTAGLARDAKARKADVIEPGTPDPTPVEGKTSRAKAKAKEPVDAVSDGSDV